MQHKNVFISQEPQSATMVTRPNEHEVLGKQHKIIKTGELRILHYTNYWQTTTY